MINTIILATLSIEIFPFLVAFLTLGAFICIHKFISNPFWQFIAGLGVTAILCAVLTIFG